MGKLIPFCVYRVGCGFPKVPLGGNHIPVYALEMGCRFPEGAQRETASHSEPEKWDTVSGWHEKASAARVAAEALFVAAHCVWVAEMSRFAPKEEGIDLRVMPDE